MTEVVRNKMKVLGLPFSTLFLPFLLSPLHDSLLPSLYPLPSSLPPSRRPPLRDADRPPPILLPGPREAL
jgi:hypothetical protein